MKKQFKQATIAFSKNGSLNIMPVKQERQTTQQLPNITS